MIEISNLNFVYHKGSKKEVVALEDINLSIKDGEFLVVIGQNGSGKSTLAKLLCGVLRPTLGEVKVDGLSTKSSEDLWRIRQKVGVIFQNPDSQIVATLVEEDVAFGPENLGLEPEETRKRVKKALEVVGMAKYACYEPHNLSAGQRQKVALAGVLAMKPKYLVLDESTAMLDPKSRKEILRIIEDLNREDNITVIYITHFIEEAICSNRVVVIQEGRIKLDGTPRKILSEVEKLSQAGIAAPPISSLAWELKKAGLGISSNPLTPGEMVRVLCLLN